MPVRTIVLSQHLENFVTSGVRDGRYSGPDEVVGEGLRLLEQRDHNDQTKLDWLRNAAETADASIDRGEGLSFASMDHLARHLQHIECEMTGSAKVSESAV